MGLSASNMNKYNGCHKYNLQESEAVHAPEKKLRLKRSATLVDTAPPKSPKHEDPPESASPKPVSLTQFATTSVIQVLDAASRHVQPQYMSYNISHLKMTNPITTLMAETEDNNDSLPISCELMTAHPSRSHDTYLIAAAILVVSAKCDEQPHALIGTLSVKPGHLSVTTNVTVAPQEKLVVGNFNLSTEDVDTLKPCQWLNDNVRLINY